MATWWDITFTGDPTDDDLEHVAELIKQGFTSGQLINDEDDDDTADADRAMDESGASIPLETLETER